MSGILSTRVANERADLEHGLKADVVRDALLLRVRVRVRVRVS